ncbi:hypothetical protein [Rhizobium yanglingense]
MAGDISKDMILTLKTSKTGAAVARDLNSYPLVTEALKAYTLPEIGPAVIDEDYGKPYWKTGCGEVPQGSRCCGGSQQCLVDGHARRRGFGDGRGNRIDRNGKQPRYPLDGEDDEKVQPWRRAEASRKIAEARAESRK